MALFGRKGKGRITVKCPSCGHTQEESSMILSTNCRACHEYLKIAEDGSVTAPYSSGKLKVKNSEPEQEPETDIVRPSETAPDIPRTIKEDVPSFLSESEDNNFPPPKAAEIKIASEEIVENKDLSNTPAPKPKAPSPVAPANIDISRTPPTEALKEEEAEDLEDETRSVYVAAENANKYSKYTGDPHQK